MNWLKLFFNPPFKDIIELARENEHLKEELRNLWFYVYNVVQKGNTDYHYLINDMHKKHNIGYIINQIDNLVKENKELKESLNAIKNA